MLDLEKVVVNPLDLYREAFKMALKTKSTARFTNSTISHAIVLIEELLNATSFSFDIYCHALSPDVWCNEKVLLAMREAFDRGVRFRVIVQESPKEENEAFVFIKEKGIPFCLYDASRELEGLDCNFVVSDRTSFRYEMNPSKREGSAYASNREYSDILNQMFDAMFKIGMAKKS